VTVHREPPTALGVTRDLSGNKERASAVPEGRARSCVCVCGGRINTPTIEPGDILFAVASHNRTARHEEWRRWMGR
jgi:hypothetical protein